MHQQLVYLIKQQYDPDMQLNSKKNDKWTAKEVLYNLYM